MWTPRTGFLAVFALALSTAMVAAQSASIASNAKERLSRAPEVDTAAVDSAAPSAARRDAVPAIDLRALVLDPAVKNFIGLSENSWDFTVPGGIPGFGPLPHGDARDTTVQQVPAPPAAAPHP
jgi:hypothetical protein